MNESTVFSLNGPEETTRDTLTEPIGTGARKILKEALEAEMEEVSERFADPRTEKGNRRIARNGYLPERDIVTGVGKVSARAPGLRDRGNVGANEKIGFSSSILPPCLGKTGSPEDSIPWLYLKGVSAGDFSGAPTAIIGREAKGFGQPVVSRLKAKWKDEFENRGNRDLSKKRYVYCWVDGIRCSVRMDDRQCIPVVMGATMSGEKELVAVEGGYRESKQSWREPLLKLKNRGLETSPELFIGDGAPGFWSAVSEVCPDSRWQRCRVRKTASILNKLPKGIQPKAKKRIHDICMADTKESAIRARDLFIETYEAKYPKAIDCLLKDRDSILSFYDFPAAHWRHIRTTNPIESTFATVRLRTAKARGCFSSQTILNMAFKLCQSAERKWRKPRGYKRLAEVMEGTRFIDGISEKEIAA